MNVKRIVLFLILSALMAVGIVFAQDRSGYTLTRDGITVVIVDAYRHLIRISNMTALPKTVELQVPVGITVNGVQARRQLFRETITLQPNERNKTVTVGGTPLNSSRGVSSLGRISISRVY